MPSSDPSNRPPATHIISILGGVGKVAVPLIHELVKRPNTTIRLLVADETDAKLALGYIKRDSKGKEKITPVPPELELVTGTLNAADTDAHRVMVMPSRAEDAIAERAVYRALAQVSAARGNGKGGLELVVKLSALGVSRDLPTDSLLFQHLESEDLMAELLLPFVILRAGFFYQHYLDEAAVIKAGVQQNVIPELPRAAIQHAMVHVDARDVAQLAAQLLSTSEDSEHGTLFEQLPRFRARTLYVSGDDPEVMTFDQVTAAMAKIFGKKVHFKVAATDDEFLLMASQMHKDRIAELKAEAVAEIKAKLEAEAKKNNKKKEQPTPASAPQAAPAPSSPAAASSPSAPSSSPAGSSTAVTTVVVEDEIKVPEPDVKALDWPFLLQFYQAARDGSMAAAYGDFKTVTGHRSRSFEGFLFDYKAEFGV